MGRLDPVIHTKQEQKAFQNITGIMKPVPHDQEETDRKISDVVKRQHRLDEKNAKLRDTQTGEQTPTTIANRNKITHYNLKQDAKNATVRLNEYGIPDVKFAEDKIAAILKARKIAADNGSLIEERRQELFLQEAEKELLAAQQRFERYRNENTRAVGLLKAWEAENLPAKKS
jgi:hypothetical protein